MFSHSTKFVLHTFVANLTASHVDLMQGGCGVIIYYIIQCFICSGGFKNGTGGTFPRAQRVKGPLRADFRQPVMH
jgi:hypothetical protein